MYIIASVNQIVGCLSKFSDTWKTAGRKTQSLQRAHWTGGLALYDCSMPLKRKKNTAMKTDNLFLQNDNVAWKKEMNAHDTFKFFW